MFLAGQKSGESFRKLVAEEKSGGICSQVRGHFAANRARERLYWEPSFRPQGAVVVQLQKLKDKEIELALAQAPHPTGSGARTAAQLFAGT